MSRAYRRRGHGGRVIRAVAAALALAALAGLAVVTAPRAGGPTAPARAKAPRCPGATPGDLDRLDARRRSALVAEDAAALRRLMAPDAVYTHSNGIAQDREALVAFVARDDVAYRAIRVDSLSWRIHEHVAVGTGTQTLELAAFGRPVTARSRFTVVWACRDGRWVCVAYQSTALPEAR